MGAGIHWATGWRKQRENQTIAAWSRINDYSNMHDFIFYGVHGSGVAAIKVHEQDFIQYPTWTGDHSYGEYGDLAPHMDFYNNTE